MNLMFSALFILQALVSLNEAARIVFIQPLGRSHYNVFLPLIKELKIRNHHVHVVISRTFKDTLPSNAGFNFTLLEPMDLDPNMMKEFLTKAATEDTIESFKDFADFVEVMCMPILESEGYKELLSKGIQFDLAIVDVLNVECTTATSRMIANHTIYLSTAGLPFWKMSNVPTPPSYVPEPFGSYTSKMTFWERVFNVYTIARVWQQYYGIGLPKEEEITQKYFPGAPSVYKAQKDAFFVITNADPVLSSPRPSMPNIVNVGGMHCKKEKPLDKEFQDFIKEAGSEGFIMFGLGSNARSDILPPEIINAFANGFSRLKIKVLWKFESDFQGDVPKNVKLTKWMPQQDLLGQSNIRLFITHGGLLSLQEAIYHGVPVVGVPIFGDQKGNVARVQELGIGEKLDLYTATADEVYEVVTKVLNDQSYETNMKKYSKIFKDHPQAPVKTAAFWAEYIIRHNGAEHLRSPGEDLSFIQYFLLDAIALVAIVVSCFIAIIIAILKMVFRRFCSKDSSKQKMQ